MYQMGDISSQRSFPELYSSGRPHSNSVDAEQSCHHGGEAAE